MEKSKEKRINAEIKRLNELFAAMPKNKYSAAEGLIKNCAFMRIELEDLSQQIIKEGGTEDYKNGANQFGVKPSAALQAYNATMKIYNSAMQSLIRLLPNSDGMQTNKLAQFLEDFSTDEDN